MKYIGLALEARLEKYRKAKSLPEWNPRDVRELLEDAKHGVDEKSSMNEFFETLERIVIELKNTTEHSTAFLQKVRKSDAPDYYNVIANPMDLGTLHKRVKSHTYRTKQAFAHDLDLIWSNCLQYNSHPSHPLRASAEFLRQKSNQLLEFISDPGLPKAPAKIVEDNLDFAESEPSPKEEEAPAEPSIWDDEGVLVKYDGAQGEIAKDDEEDDVSDKRPQIPFPEQTAIERSAVKMDAFRRIQEMLRGKDKRMREFVRYFPGALKFEDFDDKKWWRAMSAHNLMGAGIPPVPSIPRFENDAFAPPRVDAYSEIHPRKKFKRSKDRYYYKAQEAAPQDASASASVEMQQDEDKNASAGPDETEEQEEKPSRRKGRPRRGETREERGRRLDEERERAEKIDAQRSRFQRDVMLSPRIHPESTVSRPDIPALDGLPLHMWRNMCLLSRLDALYDEIMSHNDYMAPEMPDVTDEEDDTLEGELYDVSQDSLQNSDLQKSPRATSIDPFSVSLSNADAWNTHKFKTVSLSDSGISQVNQYVCRLILAHSGFSAASQSALDILGSLLSEFVVDFSQSLRSLKDRKKYHTKRALATAFDLHGGASAQDLFRYCKSIEDRKFHLQHLTERLEEARDLQLVPSVGDESLANDCSGRWLQPPEEFFGPDYDATGAAPAYMFVQDPKERIKEAAAFRAHLGPDKALSGGVVMDNSYDFAPAHVPLEPEALDEQIGLLRPFYKERLATDYQLVDDVDGSWYAARPDVLPSGRVPPPKAQKRKDNIKKKKKEA